jgi:YhcH/YjgK/YiaL family protein
MVFDNIKRASTYYSLGEKITKALKYLGETDFVNLEPGKYEIDGKDVFAIVQTYNTKPLSACKWESHKNYIDIQFLISGQEKMGYTESTKAYVVQEYDAEKDCTIYKGNGNFVTVEEGHFAIFFPSDIHMPSIALNIPKEVKKVVVKVSVDKVEIVEPITEENITYEVPKEESPTQESTEQLPQ